MIQMNQNILQHNPMSYATSALPPADVLDCSMGINPYGCPDGISEALSSFTLSDVLHYPHDLTLEREIAQYWSPVAALSEGNITVSNGSIAALFHLNRLLLHPKSRVFGPAPRFSAYTDDLSCLGALHVSYVLDRNLGYPFDLSRFLAQMKECRPDLVCIENPTNPTGLILGIDAVEQIAKEAKALDIPLIVDEAYGDFMEKHNSAISLMGRYDNLMVTRTFSKGLGLAGARIGYVVAPGAVTAQLAKISTPYDADALGRILACAALRDSAFLPRVMEQIRIDKPKMLAALRRIKAAETSPTTPIATLYCEDASVDLCAHLLTHGINAVSGASFENVGVSGVRIIVNRKIETLCQRLMAADEAL